MSDTPTPTPEGVEDDGTVLDNSSPVSSDSSAPVATETSVDNPVPEAGPAVAPTTDYSNTTPDTGSSAGANAPEATTLDPKASTDGQLTTPTTNQSETRTVPAEVRTVPAEVSEYYVMLYQGDHETKLGPYSSLDEAMDFGEADANDHDTVANGYRIVTFDDDDNVSEVLYAQHIS